MSEFDYEAGQTYIYPTNYPVREYQFDIVKSALLKNTLVCLPTGLGKTFIGAVLMYNFYRWFPTGKVVFLAPSRPLVTQQMEACFNIMGIPQEDTSEMTGSSSPELRKAIWLTKRVFFLTPQVLMNDLCREACPAQIIKLVVIDEAHKALGNHSVCQVMKQLQQQCYQFRVLALTATPGSNIQAIQQVLANLLISHIEFRSEDSPDVAEFTHLRAIKTIIIPIEGELQRIKERYMEVVKYYVFKLTNKRVLFTRDEITLSKFQLLKARESFRQNPPDNCKDRHIQGMLEGTFALCITLYHALELLLMYGIRAFYSCLKGLLEDKKAFHAKGELKKNPLFVSLIDSLQSNYGSLGIGEASTSSANLDSMASLDRFPSHPKMVKLKEILVNHFSHYQEINRPTRVMVFSQYRHSVIEITALLEQFHPMIKPISFIGQSAKERKGITQKEQIRVVQLFRSGRYNTLVSTCVGEEGLDIGEVDLIVCYDAPKSPIRLVQRMGRTGRKREGSIVVLVTAGKEEQSFKQSRYQMNSLAKAFAKDNKLARYLYSNCPRMVPEGVNPVCLKLKMVVRDYKSSVQEKKTRRQKIGSSFVSNSVLKGQSSKLSEVEMKIFQEKYQVNENEMKKIPKRSFGEMDQNIKAIGENFGVSVEDASSINVGSYQPWYTTLQPCYAISHSKVTRNLVQLTEFLNLQLTLGDNNENYAVELASYMNPVYLQSKENQECDPDFLKISKEQIPKKTLSENLKMKKKCSKVKDIKSFLISKQISSQSGHCLNNNLTQSDSELKTLLCQEDSEMNSGSILTEKMNLDDFDIPSKPETNIPNLRKERSFGFPESENIFKSLPPLKRTRLTFVDPPLFCNANSVTCPFQFRSTNLNFQVEEMHCISPFHSVFEDLTLPDLVSSMLNFEAGHDIASLCSTKHRDTVYVKTIVNDIETLPFLELNKTSPVRDPMNNSSILLTPPSLKEDKLKIMFDRKQLTPSPFFRSKRQISSPLLSSTPINNKAKNLFGISSSHITPISLDPKDGGSTLKFTNNPEFPIQGNHFDRVDVLKNQKEQKSELNFDMFMDDDEVFADIDLESIVKEVQAKDLGAGSKETNNEPESLEAQSLMKCKSMKPPFQDIISDESMKSSLLSVTQVIKLVNKRQPSLPVKPLVSENNKLPQPKDKAFSKGEQSATSQSKSTTSNFVSPNFGGDKVHTQFNDQGGTRGRLANFDENHWAVNNDTSVFQRNSNSYDSHSGWLDCSKESKLKRKKLKKNDLPLEHTLKVASKKPECSADDLTNKSSFILNNRKKDLLNDSRDLFYCMKSPEASNKTQTKLSFSQNQMAWNARAYGQKFDDCLNEESSKHTSSNRSLNAASATKHLFNESFAKLSQSKEHRKSANNNPSKMDSSPCAVTSLIQTFNSSRTPTKSLKDHFSPESDVESPLILKTKPINVIESDQEECSMVASMGEHSTSRLNMNTNLNERKGISLEENSNDLDHFSSSPVHHFDQAKKKKKSTNKITGLVNIEADIIDKSLIGITSDESESGMDEYEESFIDDYIPVTQPQAKDMQAFYLQSIRSPIKKTVTVGKLQTSDELSKTTNYYSSSEEDSFVVENDVIEYETQFLGESMLAQDPIIDQILMDQVPSKTKRQKRRRIVEFTGSSDEESSSKKMKQIDPLNSSNFKAKSVLEEEKFAIGTGSPGKRQSRLSTDLGSKPSCVQVNTTNECHLNSVVQPVNAFSPSSRVFSSSLNFEKNLFEDSNSSRPKGSGNKVTGGQTSDEIPSFDIFSDDLMPIRVNQEGFDSNLQRLHDGSKSHHSPFVGEVNAASHSHQQESGSLCIVVDTNEVSIAGMITSTLRLKYGAQTFLNQLSPASYAVSSRMGVCRINYSTFSSSNQRARLISRFRTLIRDYERPVVIVENDSKVAVSRMPPRTFYLDSISCACAQLPQLKVLYTSDQNETADFIWHLTKLEQLKNNGIPPIPLTNRHFIQGVKFYLSFPRVSCPTAIFLALNFNTIREAVNCDLNKLKTNGHMSSEAAIAFKTHCNRKFRKEFLPSSLKNEVG